MKLKILNQHDEIENIVNTLYTVGMIRTDEMVKFRQYKESIEREIDSLKFTIEEELTSKPQVVEERLKELQKELDWLNETTIYRNDYVELLDMHSLVSHLYWKQASGTRDAIWDFKKLVEMVNGYYHIAEPYKSSYKIAYGWNFALQKDNFRPYLLGCVRNYLKKNDVEFDMADLQRICALRDDKLQGE